MVSLPTPDGNSAKKGEKNDMGKPSIGARLQKLYFSKSAYIPQVVHKEIVEYAELCRAAVLTLTETNKAFFLHTLPYTKDLR